MAEENKQGAFKEDTKPIYSLLHESERAAVILAAAYIDSLLERLLKTVLHPCAGGSDSLFDGDRALGTFSAKILISHRLGIIDSDFERAIQTLRRIRNEFAHHVTDASLSTGGHRDRLRELLRWAKRHHAFEKVYKQSRSQWDHLTDEHLQFVVCIMTMAALLQRGYDELSRVDVGKPLGI
ncbi:hypothetical protein DF049_30930 [Burkholderia cenocepacia]|uniref:hypothetical protein n=1 Tax=Burkholderia cenocepacia TaxID=95486 RepID=UPI000F569A7D|nr:hypothetical protein [Burkholderia cenocepacia]RQU70700.1 hypothetical protein DF049_30930 [Burkholderia cenocepacia]